MPDLWAHIIGGEMVINKLNDKALCDVIINNRNYFNMGTQGPDFFFYNDFWPWIKEKKGPTIGNLIHNKMTIDFLIESFRKLKEKKGILYYPESLSYFMGFITHIILDKNIHQIIDNFTTDDFEHKRLELELDCYFTKKYLNSECYKLNPLNYINIGDNFNQMISQIIYSNINQMYNLNLDLDFIDKAYNDMLKVHSILYSPYKVKITILKLFTSFFSIDLNQYTYADVNSFSILSTTDIDQVEEKMIKYIKQSKNVINIYCKYLKDKIDIDQVKKEIDIYLAHTP
ncbi:MAG: zinc dependent phospholipase C family protein [Halanaerobiales bacterium]|nr:zinc dependent phospholipase C family protein [Halanaerobiales bacterium]